MLHRGPDSGGSYVENNIALGHRRLSIIDLTDSANQPFIDPSGRYVLVFNGEIYNYLEVKAKLSDYQFKTNSDTEVILAAYIKFGIKCLDLFNGMFAFGLWDNQEQKLFIARDRMGVKPIYYYHKQNMFMFASETRALMAPGLFDKEIDDDSLADFLMNQAITAPYTLFANVYQLAAGEYGIFQNGTFQKQIYWHIEQQRSFDDINDPAKVKKEIKELLTKSVELRMISDVELGAFLSGGIDSSIIVALMAEITENPINTFSMVFHEKKYDESQYSNLIAKKYNTKHISITLEPKDFLNELPDALAAMDTPSGDGINSYVISKVVKKAGFTVALSGTGGDELFAGYQHFKKFSSVKNNILFNASPYPLRKIAANVAGLVWPGIKGERFSAMMKLKDFNIENQYPLLRQVFSERSISRLMVKDEAARNNRLSKLLISRSDAIHRLPVLSQFSVAEFLGYTQNVLLKDMDQMSMANSLEVREPFFDYKLVEYVLQIPDTEKSPTYPKSLLVESFANFLPDEIVHRPKMGFIFPWDQWLKDDLRPFVEMHLKLLGERKQFNKQEIDTLWRSFLADTGGVNWIHIWQLVVLSVYLTANMGA